MVQISDSSKRKILGTILSSVVLATLLAGCASKTEATPSTSPTVKHSVGAATSAPPAAPTKFTGAVNYSRFSTNWDSSTPEAKQEACQEFLDNNPPATDIVLDENSTGPEIIAWFKATMDVVMSLAKDRSNPQNEAVAQKLAGCLSMSHDPQNEGTTWLVGQVTDAAQASFDVSYSSIASVTEYGKIYTPVDYQNRQWNAIAIAGNANDLGNTPLLQLYEYDKPTNPSKSTMVYRLSISEPQSNLSDFSSNVAKYFGPQAPITVAQ